MPQKKSWKLLVPKNLKTFVTAEQKETVTLFFAPLIASYKDELKYKAIDKKTNYTADVYSKWYQHYFYLCELIKSESPYRILDEFEEKYLRLEFIAEDKFNFYYYRHTAQWYLVKDDCTLQECLDLITENPNFKPCI